MVLNVILNASDSHTKYIPPKQTNHAPSWHRPYCGTTVNAVPISSNYQTLVTHILYL